MTLENLKRVGLSADSADNIMLDAGAIYAVEELVEGVIPTDLEQWTRLGATQGGATFTVEQEFREIDVDGVRGLTKGFRSKITITPQISANLLEFNLENLQYALPGLETENWPDENETHLLLTRKGCLEAADYIDWIALVGKLSTDCDFGEAGEPIVFLVQNALQDGAFNFDTADEDEAVMSVEFTGHYDPDTPEEEPWAILLPKEDPTVTYDVTFYVYDNSTDNAIGGAEVTFDGDVKFTQADGEITFKNMAADTYNYSVDHPDYDEVTAQEVIVDTEDVYEEVGLDESL